MWHINALIDTIKLPKAFFYIEKKILIRWILFINKREFSPQVSIIRRMADILLSVYIDRPADVLFIIGENWIRKFINRHK